MNGFVESSIPKTTKRRKDRITEGSDSHGSKIQTSGKKRGTVALPPIERSSKGKGKAVAMDYTGMNETDEFVVIEATARLSIPPAFANSPMAGVEEMLDSMIMKHVPSLQGIVLACSNIRFLDNTAQIQNDCPYMLCRVGFDATVWSPQIGMKLYAKVNLFSPDHISLLIHRTFNISIPRNHIPQNEYQFEDDVHFDSQAGGISKKRSLHPMDIDGALDVPDGPFGTENSVEDAESLGRWIHIPTRDKVGGDEGFVEFTVIGMTLVNQMISLLGSLQLDPFNPAHNIKSSVDPPHLGSVAQKDQEFDDFDEISLPAVEDLSVITPTMEDGNDLEAEARRLRKEEKKRRKAERRAMKSSQNGDVAPEEEEPKKKKRKKENK